MSLSEVKEEGCGLLWTVLIILGFIFLAAIERSIVLKLMLRIETCLR